MGVANSCPFPHIEFLVSWSSMRPGLKIAPLYGSVGSSVAGAFYPIPLPYSVHDGVNLTRGKLRELAQRMSRAC